jgi:PAS domain S-box-containing protein
MPSVPPASPPSPKAYGLLVEHAPFGMGEVASDGSLRWVNRALVDLLAYESLVDLMSPQASLGRRPPLLIDATLFEQMAASRAPIETEWPRKDGRPVLVRLRGWLVEQDAPGRPGRLAFIAEDVTERRELEDRLRLAHQLETVGRLAGGIAHDFNNMLTAILGYSDLVLQQLDDQKPIFRDLREIGKAAGRAAALTRQLLAFSHRQELSLRPLDINVVVSDVVPMIRRLIGEHVTIETRLEDQLPAITGDLSLVEQLLVNLSLNARDAMPNGGTLTLTTSSETLDADYAMTHAGFAPGRFVRLTVTDTGTGMTPDVKSKIFDPFFTTKEAGQGTGLGLASVYRTVQQLGGYVWVYSEIHEGAVFKLYFPRVEKAPVGPTQGADLQGQPVGSETVLLVEDEATVRAFCQTVLERHGYRVTASANPDEAFKSIEAGHGAVNLILTDIAMPGMDGYEMVRRLRDSHPGFKTLYMSGYAERFQRKGVRADPDATLIEKPFTAAQLLRCVRETLDRKS